MLNKNRLSHWLDFADAHEGIVIALLLGIVVTFFGPALLNPQTIIWGSTGSDIESTHWQELNAFGESLRSGQLQLWSSLIALGRPLAGDPDSLYLYPFTALFAVLPPAFAFTVFFATHIFLMGLFTYWLLAKGFNVARPAALAGGLAFAFAPKVVAHLAVGHVGIIAGLAWCPAVLLALKYALDGKLVGAGLAGLALALQMPTHLYIAFYTGFIAAGLACLYLFSALARRDWRRVRWVVLVSITWLLSAALLSAAFTAPFFELLTYSTRVDFTLADANAFALMPPLLITLVAPARTVIHEWVIYLGVLPPLFIIAALAFSKQPIRWALLAFAIFAIIYALGSVTPLFEVSRLLLPGFDKLRVPTRLWFFGGLAVALLLSFGLDSLRDSSVQQKILSWRPWLWRAVGVYVIGVAAAFATYSVIFHQWHWQLLVQACVVMALGGLLHLWTAGRLSGQTCQWLLLPLLCLDLLPLDSSYIHLVIPGDTFLKPSPEETFLLSQPRGSYRVYSPLGNLSFALMGVNKIDLLEAQLGLQLAASIDAIRSATNCPRTNYAISVPACLDDKTPPESPNAQLLGQLNVKYVVTPQELTQPDFQRVFVGQESVYENLKWQPRVRVAPDGRVEVEPAEAGSYRLQVDLPTAGMLTVSEAWLPGWQATVDGREQTTVRVEGALIGLPLEAGVHAVQLRYYPALWAIGWPVSLISIVVLLIWVLLTVRNSLPVNQPVVTRAS